MAVPVTLADPPYFAMLNDRQREAVAAVDGPVLVLAGAGTGKTRVLTTRLAHILLTGRARPAELLAVTFTNKAAHEMRERVGAILGRPVEGWWIGTFHALAARIVRAHADLVGLKPNFTILDMDDQHRLLKQIIQAAGLDDKKWPARALNAVIQRWKDRGLTPEKVTRAEAGDFADGRARQLYEAYQERLRVLNAADFGDLLLHCLTLFAQNADVLARYQDRFRYLLVDEYQDTNVAQYLWLRLLAQRHRNICCVGDDDQSIYGWRGAEVGNILRFDQDFPGAAVIRLEQNYRSSPHILGAASGLIAHNEGRLGKTLWTERDDDDKVRVRGVWDGPEEARVVGETIEALQRDGHGVGQMAILVRAGFQTREFEERLLTLGVPYRVIGGPRFYERAEIRDAIAYLRVVVQPDDDLALERIVNTPRRGIGRSALQQVHVTARAQGSSLSVAVRRLVETDELPARTRRAFAGLLADFDRWRALAQTTPPAALAGIVLDESGYTDMWRAEKSVDAPGRLENLKELIVALQEFETLQGFLDHVSLVAEQTEQAGVEMVSIMTLHGAKGLEFDYVFLAGWEDGLFPHQRALDESGLKGLEEERRLAYVGLTRARKRAYVTHAANRRVNNLWQSALPSRFIDELPDEHVVREAEDGMYRGRGGGFGEAAAVPYAAGATDWGPIWRSGGRTNAPGRRYDQLQRGRREPPTIDGVAELIKGSSEEAARFAPGERVFHQKFGYGSVTVVEGEKLAVAFEKAGEKRVLASFVIPADHA
ncbi:MAG: ATP-dependent helicase [Alphaproteobacteria bacterium]